ncbi:MAG: ATP-dependent helicase C-terminal domain-containing protein, partial [Dokdonella sp.]
VENACVEERALACDLVALIEARNPLRGDRARSDDLRDRLHALQAWRNRDTRAVHASMADIGALAAIAQNAQLWRRRINASSAIDNATSMRSSAAGDILMHAFPDRIACQHADNPRRYQMTNGRGARLHEDSAVFGEPWLVIVDLRHEERDSLILSAAPLDESRLRVAFAERFTRARTVRWQRHTRTVEVSEEQRFGAIVLQRRAVAARPEDTVPALLAAVRDLGLDALDWSASSRELRVRVQVLRQWRPELGLPDFSDQGLLDTIEAWLAPALAGKRRLDALGADQLAAALAAQLDHSMRRALDELAPRTIKVPSGLERPIQYVADGAPILAVKLQELFGLADTPRIDGGRVALTLHLLSPGARPIQVTQDLRSFWERTYPEARKELKGRYPRHPWPDDPWTAMPTHRAKLRGT